MNHEIDMSNYNVRTDLAIEITDKYEKTQMIKNVKVTTIKVNNDKKMNKYITLEFNDATDYNNCKDIEYVLIKKLKELYKDYKITDKSSCLVIGLGNINSTPDSLGPQCINDIIVTSHYFKLGINVLDGFRSVSAIKPGTMGETGIESFDIVKSITDCIKPDFVIVIDSLKASNVNRINKIIQITDAGINPGSGIGNNRKEISMDVLNIPVIAIGVPTVVDTFTIINDTLKKMSKKCINEVLIDNNMIVTPKEIDFEIKKLSNIISTSINNSLHKNITDL